jgi:hypothetical protein
MATTANLLVTHIEQSQSQKEVTANEAFDILDAATQGDLSVSTASLGSPSEVVLTQTQFLQNYIFKLTASAADHFNLTVPAETHTFAVDNASDYACTVTIVGTTSQVIIPAGGCGIIHSDATALVQLSGQYDLGFYFSGTPNDGDRVGYVFPHKATIGIMSSVNAQGSQARVVVPSAADEGSVAFDLQKNGASFGSVTFAAGATSGTFSVAAATSFSVGDIIEAVCPSFGSPTTIMSGIGITIRSGVKVYN